MHILCSNVSIEAKQVMENIGIFEYFTNVAVAVIVIPVKKNAISFYYLFTLFVCRPITPPL